MAWRVDALRAGMGAAIALAALGVYWPALHGGWLWDDGLEVARNSLLRDPQGWWKAWVAPTGLDYLPLKDTLQWLEWRLWGGSVFGYHLANLGMHVVCALLVWRILVQLGARRGWVGGALFAVHPLAVESVAWISEFKNTLSLAGLLISFSCYIEWDRWPGCSSFRSPSPSRKASRPLAVMLSGTYLLALAWFLFAMLCKSSVVLFPLMLLMFAWWRQGRVRSFDLAAAVPFLAIAAVCASTELWFQWHRAMGSAAPRGGGLGARMLNSGWSVAAYAWSCLWPARLAPEYAPGPGVLTGLICWAGLVLIVACLWVSKPAWTRHALLGLAWFVINLVPALGWVPIAYLRVAPRADHFAYVALVGVCGLAAAAVSAAPCKPLMLAAALMAASALGLIARVHAAIFRSPEALWTYAVQRVPTAWLARNNLARIDLDEGRPRQALAQLAVAVGQRPDSAEVHANLGSAWEQVGRVAKAEAEFREAIRLEPEEGPFHYDLGKLLLVTDRPLEAAVELKEAIALDPEDAQAHNNLGVAWSRLGKAGDAAREFVAALRLDPDLPEAQVNLGNAAFRAGDLKGALAAYRAALRIDPDYAAAHRDLAVLLERLGRFGEAKAELEAAERGR